MNPKKVFDKALLDNPEVCNHCFRRRAYSDEIPEGAPDFVTPQYYLGGGSTIDYPPDRTNEFGIVSPSEAPTTSHHIWGKNEWMETEISRPTIVCACGVIDDEPIDDGFPEDWEDRSFSDLENVGLRVYHRVEEDGFDIDFDRFMKSLSEYKSSDEYDDYEALSKSVEDSVSVKSQNA